jgi:hypothetical protein
MFLREIKERKHKGNIAGWYCQYPAQEKITEYRKANVFSGNAKERGHGLYISDKYPAI